MRGGALPLSNATAARLIDTYTSVPRPGELRFYGPTPPCVPEIESKLGRNFHDYDAVYHGRSEWKLLPAYDHPGEPSRCLVAGTGLTHRASVDNRQAMHDQNTAGETQVTDSMRMYQWGLQGGTPEPGLVGVPAGVVLQRDRSHPARARRAPGRAGLRGRRRRGA